MRACGGTHTKDMPWDQGVHGEFINGLLNFKSSQILVSN